MLVIVMNDNMEHQWHVGQRVPLTDLVIEHVQFVQADCDELAWITQEFTNLPLSKGRVQRWYGDTAKMIAWRLRG